MKYRIVAEVLLAMYLSLQAGVPLVNINDTQYWLNGINLPWIQWEDFDDPWESNNYSHDDFEEAFSRYAQNGINAVRVWVHCKGEGSPVLDSAGNVTGPSDVFWDNFSDMLFLADQYDIFVMPALFSFDILDEERAVSKYPNNTGENFAKLVADSQKTTTYIENFLVELLDRFDSSSAIFCWEVCNEPEWMSENLGANRGDVIRFNAQIAAAIHRYGTKYVCTGSASLKWYGAQYDWWSDDTLQSYCSDTLAYFDIHQIHYYDWMDPDGEDPWGFNPWEHSPEDLGLGGRPVIIGECPGDGGLYRSAEEMYEQAYNLGYAGVFGWSDQADDGHGTFAEISEATNHMHEQYPDRVGGIAAGVSAFFGMPANSQNRLYAGITGDVLDIGFSGRVSRIKVIMYSLNGREVYAETLFPSESENRLSLDLAKAVNVSGVFLLRIEAEKSKISRIYNNL